MFGVYIVISLEGAKDKAGFDTIALVKNRMNESIQGRMYLPPYLRKGESNIDAGSEIVGFLDIPTGFGFAVVGLDDADFQYFYDADINIKKKLTVDDACDFKDKLDVSGNIKSSSGNIEATSGDVKATLISLQNHTHNIPTATIPTATPLPPATAAVYPGGVTLQPNP